MLRYDDDLEINGINITPYLVDIKFNYNKLWGSDTGRSLSGKFTGTLLGIFPKFECTFRRLTEEELELLTPVFDSPVQTLTYYDPYKKEKLTIETYSGDFAFNQKKIFSKLAKAGSQFTVSFIATTKRS